MAKSKDEQLALIDVDDPKYKEVKKQIVKYEKIKDDNKEQVSQLREAEKAQRQKVFEAVTACGIKPDADGYYHITVDGKVYDIGQDSQLKIKKHNAPKEDDDIGDDDGDEAGGDEPTSDRRPRG